MKQTGSPPSILVDDIGELVTNVPELGEDRLGLIRDAAVLFVDGVVDWVGPRAQAPSGAEMRHDLGGRAALPGFVDSHTHLVFAGDRAVEFAARMSGEEYDAGGIRDTVAATRAATDGQLEATVVRLAGEALRAGTTTLEIKSGYGQTIVDEQRSLAVAARHARETTLLAAHVTPPEFAGRTDDYVRMVCDEMVDACAAQAKWIDVFCERGAFDRDQSAAVLSAGMRSGLVPRVHANQLGPGPGVQLAVEVGAASVDHVSHTTAADVEALAGADTVATLLPGAEFCTRSAYPDARRLLDAGVTVALASDCNPGTSYTTDVGFCIALAVREMRMTPAEAVWSATMGGAVALRRNDIGRLGIGCHADLIALDAPSHLHLAYRPGVALVREVWRDGRLVVR
ncbi:imidazolonepropionase [Rhodococcus sp. D2-41]|uniref:Imidazolonepropionase n=1 Tax=Speluncibacter jeojiensis TaxID=2710754 RepID=A0A9X4RD49_9ACTN|nr:imidazolonepropionase [Rhodococcus sp. D2-41]MDG3010506.1 imidazolonepropionase [Rhodococcus sp. D2-41]MDG3014254.1 imidazolonepropionase [Corynebacteriales bacterium D3-21]